MGLRIRGLLVIVRTLMPLIAVVVVAAVSVVAAQSIRAEAEAYRESLSSDLEVVAQTLDSVSVFVTTFGDALTKADESLGSIPTDVNYPKEAIKIPRGAIYGGMTWNPDPKNWVPNSPVLTIPALPGGGSGYVLVEAGSLKLGMPGAQELKDFFEQARAAVVDTKDFIKSIGPCHRAADGQSIRCETDGPFGAIYGSMLMWILVVTLTVFAAVLVSMTTRASLHRAELRRGWALMKGEPPSTAGVDEIRAQLRDLEARLERVG